MRGQRLWVHEHGQVFLRHTKTIKTVREHLVNICNLEGSMMRTQHPLPPQTFTNFWLLVAYGLKDQLKWSQDILPTRFGLPKCDQETKKQRINWRLSSSKSRNDEYVIGSQKWQKRCLVFSHCWSAGRLGLHNGHRIWFGSRSTNDRSHLQTWSYGKCRRWVRHPFAGSADAVSPPRCDAPPVYSSQTAGAVFCEKRRGIFFFYQVDKLHRSCLNILINKGDKYFRNRWMTHKKTEH